MVSSTRFIFIAVLLVSMAVICSGAASEESVLTCDPSQAEINQDISCTIEVRDSQQEPTTAFDTSDFAIRVVAEETDVTPTISSLAATADPSIVAFTVRSTAGTNLRINVVIKTTGNYIRGSGATATILMWPASSVGAVECLAPSVELRSTTTCWAMLYGPNQVHAALHSSDVQFSEGHGVGSFTYISGAKKLIFNFSAPASPSSTFDAFDLRITLVAAKTVFTHRLPVAYPQLQANARSVLSCTNISGSSTRLCTVTGIDPLGPVRFNQTNFRVLFERNVSNQWVDITSTIYNNFSQSELSVGNLTFRPLVDNEIYPARLGVYVGKAAILGSPYLFQMGQVPTASQLTLRGCSAHYVVTGNTTVCTIDVNDGITADPTYVTLTTSLSGGTVIGPTFGRTSANTSILTFVYTPPAVDTWAQEYLGATVGGVNIVSSPYAMVVFQSELGSSTSGSSGAAQILIFLFLFVGVAVVAAGFWFRWDKIAILVKDFRQPIAKPTATKAQAEAMQPVKAAVDRSYAPIVSRPEATTVSTPTVAPSDNRSFTPIVTRQTTSAPALEIAPDTIAAPTRETA